MNLVPTPLARRALLSALGVLACSGASAALTPIGSTDFAASAALLDYSGATLDSAVDGQTLGGVQHGFAVGGSASNDATISIQPGLTDFLTPFDIEGDADGVLSLRFARAQSQLGFAWGLSDASGGEISLFDASHVLIGTLSFSGAADSLLGFQTGFAGVHSDTAFDSAEVRWNGSGRFAFDDLRFDNADASGGGGGGGGGTVPEPPMPALLLAAVVSACAARRLSGR